MTKSEKAYIQKKFGEDIYQELDGFYYYDPKPNRGFYSSYLLRTIADYLDELNEPQKKQIDEHFGASKES